MVFNGFQWYTIGSFKGLYNMLSHVSSNMLSKYALINIVYKGPYQLPNTMFSLPFLLPVYSGAFCIRTHHLSEAFCADNNIRGHCDTIRYANGSGVELRTLHYENPGSNPVLQC